MHKVYSNCIGFRSGVWTESFERKFCFLLFFFGLAGLWDLGCLAWSASGLIWCWAGPGGAGLWWAGLGCVWGSAGLVRAKIRKCNSKRNSYNYYLFCSWRGVWFRSWVAIRFHAFQSPAATQSCSASGASSKHQSSLKGFVSHMPFCLAFHAFPALHLSRLLRPRSICRLTPAPECKTAELQD